MSKASKIFEKMKNTKHGWTPDDLHTVYTGHGFKSREGSRHTIYYHPEHPDLMATVARHSYVVVGYIQTAIKLIEKLQELERGETK